MPPPMSIWLSSQPPKMSPLALVSAGIAMVRMQRSPDGSVSALGVACAAGVSVIDAHSCKYGKAQLIRPYHFEHSLRSDLEIVAAAAGAGDRACQRGLIHAVLDHGLVDMDGNHLAQGQPPLRLPAVGALQLDDL